MPNKEEIKKFSDMIHDLKNTLDCTYMDAIIEHCSKSGLEVEVAATLISQNIRDLIREEAEKLNMMKKTKRLEV